MIWYYIFSVIRMTDRINDDQIGGLLLLFTEMSVEN